MIIVSEGCVEEPRGPIELRVLTSGRHVAAFYLNNRELRMVFSSVGVNFPLSSSSMNSTLMGT